MRPRVSHSLGALLASEPKQTSELSRLRYDAMEKNIGKSLNHAYQTLFDRARILFETNAFA